MKIMTVVGARPNFMKAAPIIKAISNHNGASHSSPHDIQHVLVHTGQHYDALMSDAFFNDLNMPQPDIFLGVGSGSHAVQTAEVMKRFEEVVLQSRPDVVVVVGDVNSTVACALVTAKISPDRKPLLAHVEAGLRSFDRTMPEECNRVLTDHLADLLFVTEESGIKNLVNEGISPQRLFLVGNTMIDTLLAFEQKAEASSILERVGLRSINGNGNRPTVKPYALLTVHRPANVDTPEKFVEILEGLQELVASHEVVFPVHPRTSKNIQQHKLESYFEISSHQLREPGNNYTAKIKLIDPQGYLDFVCLMKNARLVITDSGGIQEETTCLGIPCVTVRENTERPVTVTAGTNVIAGVQRHGIRRAIQQQLTGGHENSIPDKWDGMAARRIIEILASEWKKSVQGADRALTFSGKN